MAVLSMALLAPGAAAAADPVGVGHSGWYWGNPLPQGNFLSAVALNGQRAFAVGGDGTVLRSDDAGASWTGLGSGTRQDLSLVQAVGPNTVIAAGGCTVRRSDDGGATFRRLPFTPSDAGCPSRVGAVSFTSSQVGYVVLANGTVLRTTDGGRTFGQRTSVPDLAGGGTVDIDFVTDEVGTAVGRGRIYRTVNGGNSWTAVSAAGGSVTTLRFLSATAAVAVGAGGTFLTSADAGATFTAAPLAGPGAGKEMTGVACVDTQRCLMTLKSNQLVSTTDGGATSSLVTAADAQIDAVDAGPSGRIVGVGSGGVTVLSDDAGATFAPIGRALAGSYKRIRSAYGGRAYALGANGRVARTVDGGRSWSEFGVPTAGDMIDVSFPSPTVGFALDNQGALLRTDNAGDSWRILDPGVRGAEAIMALDARRLAVIGPRGVRRSTNGGDSFGASRSPAVRGAELSGVDRAGGSIVAWGAKRVAISANGGTTWSRVRTPKGTIADVDFVDRRHGFLVTGGERLYATANGGRRWRALNGTGGQVGEIEFADRRHGFASVAGSDLMRTDDGGRTWEPQVVSELESFAAPSANGGIASDSGRRLFGTVTGGHLSRPSKLTVKLSKRRLRRAGTVSVRGKVTPASPGSVVTVILRRGTRFQRINATVASTGAFSASFRVKGTSEILAQWRGDDRLDGAGTAPVKVTVAKRKRRR